MKIVEPSVSLLRATDDPEKLIELAGRTCYNSLDKITDDSHVQFIKSIMKRGHHSVLEHASATFGIVCDRGVMAEFTRHRHASFSVQSTRYCDFTSDKMGNAAAYIKPIELDERCLDLWLAAMRQSGIDYGDMIKAGYKPEIARSVLPNALATSMVVTANFREWLHILKLRTDKAAHPDFRVIANMIGQQLYEISPTVFEEYK